MIYYKKNNIPFGHHTDGRLPLSSIYHEFKKLTKQGHWNSELIYSVNVENNENITRSLPCYSFKTTTSGSAIYLIAGIHGEEPAGPNALARSVKYLEQLSKQGFSMIVIPLANPKGYTLNWRYPNEVEDPAKGQSVGDSEHLLLSVTNNKKPRSSNPSSWYADKFTKYLTSLLDRYPPKLVLDFHEDDNIGRPYIYSHGQHKTEDPIAKLVVKLLIDNGIKLQLNGFTERSEKIENGVVYSEDGSIDEFLAAKKYVDDGKIKVKPAASSAIVVETPTRRIPLEERVKIHQLIIKSIPSFWEMLT